MTDNKNHVEVVPTWHGFNIKGLENIFLSLENHLFGNLKFMMSNYRYMIPLICVSGIVCYRQLTIGMALIPCNPLRFHLLRWVAISSKQVVDITLFHLRWFPLTSLYSCQLHSICSMFKLFQPIISLTQICSIFLGRTFWRAYSISGPNKGWEFIYDLLFVHEKCKDETDFPILIYQQTIQKAYKICNQYEEPIVLTCCGELILRILCEGEKQFNPPTWNLQQWNDDKIEQFKNLTNHYFYSSLFLAKYNRYI